MAIPMKATRSRIRPATIGGLALILTLGLAGCDPNRPGGGISKQTIGGGLGAAAGVALGSAIGAGGGRTAAMIVGGLLGAVVGSELGRSMDERDRMFAAQANQDALETYPSGRSNTWSNPDSGNSGSITPDPAYVDASGQTCRDFTQTIR